VFYEGGFSAFYGPQTQEQLKESINKLHNVPEKLLTLPASVEFVEQSEGRSSR
jgi:hypothetical protein